MKITRSTITSLSAALLTAASGCGMLGGDSSSEGDRETLGSGGRIPKAARVVEEGSGGLEYSATDDGTIYVQDADTKTTIVSRRVERGDRVRVEFDEDRVRVGDETVFSGNLERDNPHRIYFDREGETAAERRRRRADD
jgi:hypothetical protein